MKNNFFIYNKLITALPFFLKYIAENWVNRVSAIVLLFYAILIYYKLKSISSRIAIYSGLPHITINKQLMDIILYIIASLKLIAWPLIKNNHFSQSALLRLYRSLFGVNYYGRISIIIFCAIPIFYNLNIENIDSGISTYSVLFNTPIIKQFKRNFSLYNKYLNIKYIAKAYYFKYKVILLNNKYIFYIYKSLKVIVYIILYWFTFLGLISFINFYKMNGGDFNIFYVLYQNVKLTIYELYQYTLINIREYINSLIDINIDTKMKETPSPVESSSLIDPSTHEGVEDLYKEKEESFELSESDHLLRQTYNDFNYDFDNNDKPTPFYKSPNFHYLSGILLALGIGIGIIIYNYDNILHYFNPVQHNININLLEPSPTSTPSDLTIKADFPYNPDPNDFSRIYKSPIYKDPFVGVDPLDTIDPMLFSVVPSMIFIIPSIILNKFKNLINKIFIVISINKSPINL